MSRNELLVNAAAQVSYSHSNTSVALDCKVKTLQTKLQQSNDQSSLKLSCQLVFQTLIDCTVVLKGQPGYGTCHVLGVWLSFRVNQTRKLNQTRFLIPVSSDNFFYCDADLRDHYFPGFSLFFAGTLVFEVLIFVFVLGDLGGLFISLVDCKFYLL